MRKAIAAILTITLITSCKKDIKQTPCEACSLIGTYLGTFHDVGGCYGCIPYTDTTFTGSFTVDTLHNDSIIVTRNFDSYERRFAYNDTSYSRNICCVVSESFTFKQGDSLIYFYNNGGSGGCFREEFWGKKQ